MSGGAVTPATRITRVLIVGLGSIGRRHLRVARALLGAVEFAALRSGTSTSASDDPTVTMFSSLDEAVRFAPDVAVIASPASRHADVAARLAMAGIHLLIEKPLTDGLSTALELREVVARTGVTAAVGYNLRHSESLVAFRDAVQRGVVGRVMSVRSEVAQYLPDWRPETDYRTSVSAQRALGGGVLLELSHELDYLLWLFGDVVMVSAVLSRVSDLSIDTEDVANLLLQFASRDDAAGVVASVTLDFARRDTVRRCTVAGTVGTLEWDGVRGSVRRYDATTREWTVLCEATAERDATYRAEWVDLCACIAGGGTPRADIDAGVAVLRVVDAARRSAATQASVALSPDGSFARLEA